jgi:hypothetical protein
MDTGCKRDDSRDVTRAGEHYLLFRKKTYIHILMHKNKPSASCYPCWCMWHEEHVSIMCGLGLNAKIIFVVETKSVRTKIQ